VRRRAAALQWLNWDDGIAVWIDNKLVFDHRAYPPEGHGLLFRDRYVFEERVPVVVPRGKSRLAATCINSHGSWGFAIRFTDAEGFPLEGLTFSVPARWSRPDSVNLVLMNIQPPIHAD